MMQYLEISFQNLMLGAAHANLSGLRLPGAPIWWLIAMSMLVLPSAVQYRLQTTAAEDTPGGRRVAARKLPGNLVRNSAGNSAGVLLGNYARKLSHSRDILMLLSAVLGIIWLLGQLPAGVVIAAGITTAASMKVFSTRVRSRRQQHHQAHLLRLLTVMSAQLRAGGDVIQALERSLEVPELPEEIRAGIKAAARSMRQGATGEVHLAAVPGLVQLATILQVSQTRGIAAAELIIQTQRRLQANREYARSLEAETQGARVTARVLMVLPVVGMGMAMVLGINIFEFFTDTTFGQAVLIAGVSSAVAGWLWTERMIQHACDPAT